MPVCRYQNELVTPIIYISNFSCFLRTQKIEVCFFEYFHIIHSTVRFAVEPLSCLSVLAPPILVRFLFLRSLALAERLVVSTKGISHVRFTPESRHVRCKQERPLWANSGHRKPFCRRVLICRLSG